MVLMYGTIPTHEKTLDQIRRLQGGLHWRKVEALLRNLGAEVYEGSGSTVTFVLDGVKLTADRPHPHKECGRGLVKRVRTYLDGLGYLALPSEEESDD
jgi:hypothetical protein